MRRVRSIAVVLLAAVAAATAACGAGTPRNEAAAAFWETSKALDELDYDVEDVLLHARLREPGELADQLRALADRGARESRALAPYELPERFEWRRNALREALDAQVATLRRTADRALAAGPPAARRATPRLLAQSERIGVLASRYNLVLQSGG